MKYFIFIQCVLLQVISIFQTNGIRIKRQADERWSWGNVSVDDEQPTINVRQSKQSVTTTESPENPCTPVKVPDFRVPGRRLSRIKCLEYIWGIKEREERPERERKCDEYLRAQGFLIGRGGIGGRNALPGEFPHMGAIGWIGIAGEWVFKCGGSLISEKFVLTAAHCSQTSSRDITVADINPKIVRLADKNILDRSEAFVKPYVDAEILRVIIHPDFKPPKKYNDIALMELKEEVNFNKYVHPACLYTGPDSELVGKKAAMTGWGVVETVNCTTSPELQVVTLDVLESQLCDDLLRPSCNRLWCGIQEHQVCAGVLKGGADACQGDSGGPLQMEMPLPQKDKDCGKADSCRRMHQIIGVTSFGIGCALPKLPGLYTRVSRFLDWIEPIVWQ